jgi:hypothetical protein
MKREKQTEEGDEEGFSTELLRCPHFEDEVRGEHRVMLDKEWRLVDHMADVPGHREQAECL